MPLPPDNLILFDGVCNLCSSSVQFIIRHDRRAVFKFTPIQSHLGEAIYREAGLEPNDPETFLVLSSGRTLVRSDAALEVARHFGGFWRLLSALRVVPRSWRDAVYRAIAKRRYRWFGKRDACLVPSEEIKQRFVT